jgi:hypothetical protein
MLLYILKFRQLDTGFPPWSLGLGPSEMLDPRLQALLLMKGIKPRSCYQLQCWGGHNPECSRGESGRMVLRRKGGTKRN